MVSTAGTMSAQISSGSKMAWTPKYQRATKKFIKTLSKEGRMHLILRNQDQSRFLYMLRRFIFFNNCT